MVAVAAGVRWDDFGTAKYCWLTTRDGTIWAFVGPVLAILAVNIAVFVLVLRNILIMGARMKSRRSSKDESLRYQQFKKGVRATMSFFSLLGVTWVFGALAIGKAAVAFFYLFALCNTLQGVFIFAFHCYADKNVRKKFVGDSTDSTSSSYKKRVGPLSPQLPHEFRGNERLWTKPTLYNYTPAQEIAAEDSSGGAGATAGGEMEFTATPERSLSTATNNNYIEVHGTSPAATTEESTSSGEHRGLVRQISRTRILMGDYMAIAPGNSEEPTVQSTVAVPASKQEPLGLIQITRKGSRSKLN